MEKHSDWQRDRLQETIRRLFPKAKMHEVLDDVAGQRIARTAFRNFVWHTMPKMAAERVSGRRWELVAGDLRHKAAEIAVIYTMHCIYERAAKGHADLALEHEETESWADIKVG